MYIYIYIYIYIYLYIYIFIYQSIYLSKSPYIHIYVALWHSGLWRRGIVVITTAQFHSTKPELRFYAGSKPARNVSEIRYGETSDNGLG